MSSINSEQMPQALGIPELNNTMFWSKKYPRSKQFRSTGPNAVTKALVASCRGSKEKLQLCPEKLGIVLKWRRRYSCKSRRESNTVSGKTGRKTIDAQQGKILLCLCVFRVGGTGRVF